MTSSVKLGVLVFSLLFVSGLAGCTDQEAEKRAQLAEDRAVAAEKLLMLEKQMKDDATRREADRKFTEGRYEGSTGKAWRAF